MLLEATDKAEPPINRDWCSYRLLVHAHTGKEEGPASSLAWVDICNIQERHCLVLTLAAAKCRVICSRS